MAHEGPMCILGLHRIPPGMPRMVNPQGGWVACEEHYQQQFGDKDHVHTRTTYDVVCAQCGAEVPGLVRNGKHNVI